MPTWQGERNTSRLAKFRSCRRFNEISLQHPFNTVILNKMEALLSEGSTLSLQTGRLLLRVSGSSCATMQRLAIQQSIANARGLLDTLESASRLSDAPSAAVPAVPSPWAVHIAFAATMILISGLILLFWSCFPRHTARVNHGATYGSVETIDLEMGLGVQALASDHAVRPQVEVWAVRLQARARGYLARMAFRKRVEAQTRATDSSDASTESDSEDDGDVEDLLRSGLRLTQAECLEVVRSVPLLIEQYMPQPPASGPSDMEIIEPESPGEMSRQLREGLRLACDRLAGGRGDELNIPDAELHELAPEGAHVAVGVKALGSIIFRLELGGLVCLIDAIAAVDSLGVASKFLSHVQQSTGAQLLVCSAAKSAESWWLKENFQHAHAARKRRDICTRDEVLTKLQTEAQKRGLDEGRLAKFVHAQAKNGGFYFPVLYRWVI